VDYVNHRATYLTIIVLVVINLINYMDRYTVAGREWIQYGTARL